MMLSRVLAVTAALLLVGAVALAILAPPDIALNQALFLLDHRLPAALRGGIEGHIAGWAWRDLAVPLLRRPAWLIPASIGLICAGASVTLGSGPGPGKRRRPGSPRRWF